MSKPMIFRTGLKDSEVNLDFWLIISYKSSFTLEP